MDIIQDYAFTAYGFYNSADPYIRPIRTTFFSLQARAYPVMLPYLNKAAILAQESPGIITVGVLLLVLLIVMQILNYMRRLMMFWIRVMTTILFWGGVVIVVALVWQRGVGKSVEDVVGWGRELSEVWWREYRRWEGYQKLQQGKQGKHGGRSSWS